MTPEEKQEAVEQSMRDPYDPELQEKRIKDYQESKKDKNPPMRNPLRLGRVRNKKCICGSGVKIKNCCGVPVWVEWKIGQLFTAAIRGDQFTFDYIKKDILEKREEDESTKNNNA